MGELTDDDDASTQKVFVTTSPADSRSSPDALYVYGVNVRDYPSSVQMIGLSTAVFFVYMSYSFFQELIFSVEEYTYGVFMTFCQFLLYTCISYIAMVRDTTPRSNIPLYKYGIIGGLTVATISLSNASLVYLTYPLQVIFKSSKVIPVMLAGFLFFKKKYSFLEASSMVVLAVGLILFTLGDIQVEPDFNSKGIVLISLALVADALIGNYQEAVMKAHKCSLNEMIFYTHAIALGIVFVLSQIHNEFFEAIEFCNARPIVYVYMLCMSLSSFLGISLVLVLLQLFGPVVTVTVTTTRKFFTILVSFLVFPKPLTAVHLFSGFLVFGALFGDVYAKNGPKVKSALQSMLKSAEGFFR